MGDLLAECDLFLDQCLDEREYCIPHDRYDLVARLRREGALRDEDSLEKGIYLRAAPPPSMQELLRPFALRNGSTDFKD